MPCVWPTAGPRDLPCRGLTGHVLLPTAQRLLGGCRDLLRPCKQLFGRLHSGGRGRRATEHGRQLLDALVAARRLDVGARAAALDALGDAEVTCAERGHLWEAVDAQHLVCLTEQAPLLTHDL